MPKSVRREIGSLRGLVIRQGLKNKRRSARYVSDKSTFCRVSIAPIPGRFISFVMTLVKQAHPTFQLGESTKGILTINCFTLTRICFISDF
jgi:hypothetical protein